MIGRLRGIVAEIGEEEALIDVGGVGYVVRCGSRTLGRLPAIGDETVVHVEHQWSEAQGPRLYGFSTREERSVFVLLQAIQGVGPKAAMAVLDVLPPADLAGAVQRGDQALVARANGVGPKLAQRIVLELKGKPLGDGLVSSGAPAAGETPRVHKVSATGEAVAALMGLGIAEPVGRRAVEHAMGQLGDEADVGALVKAALREIGR
ncbi:MAG: Holliday junction branch migration protein RuvA [Caulobacter sp.]|nr:Holliday junction branch migration protein RuvA [Caulobacter sp.]